MTQIKNIVIFGGTGFVGRHIVRRLTKAGHNITVITRNPEKAYFLKPYGDIGQIIAKTCDLHSQDSIQSVIQDADTVINCIGILFETRKSRFYKIHAELPQKIARACANEDTDRLIHISALGVDISNSKYSMTKLSAEHTAREIFPNITVVRPSVIFGHEDNFMNKFASLPFYPVIGGGKTKIQPIYVDDVALAIEHIMQIPKSSNDSPQGQTYELGGPETLTMCEIYNMIDEQTDKNKPRIPMPFCLTKIFARLFSLIPYMAPPITADQVESLKTDNTVSEGSLGLEQLGITPKPLRSILPQYMKRHCKNSTYAQYKAKQDLI